MSEAAKSSAARHGQSGAPQVTMMRTQLGQVRGLGAARSGTAQWWAERVTAIALVPLTLWFVLSVFHLEGAPRSAVVAWAGHPFNAALLTALIIAAFHHAQLGLQAVVEDYVHTEAARFAALLAIKGLAFLLGLIALIAVLRMVVLA
jgi:succinate dehydrogenase / fumarate reductase membrane anchor subunit